jgi:hypothetical protein
VASDFADQIVGQERDLRADVRKAAVRGDEDDLVAVLAYHAEDSDVDFVLEVLVAEVLRDGTIIPNRTDRIILSRRGDEPTPGGDRGNSAKDRLVVVLKLHHDK